MRRKGKQNILPSEPDIPQFKKEIKPGSDFYRFVNGNWLRHVNMPAYSSSYGVSEEIEGLINKELLELLDGARYKVRTTADKHIPHTTYLIGTLAESVLNAQVQNLNVKTLKTFVGSLKCIRNTEELGGVLGEFIKYRINSVLGFVVVPPATDATTLRLALSFGGLGLPDSSYYKTPQSRVIGNYTKLIRILSEHFDVPGLERFIALEYDAANVISKTKEDDEILMSGAELESKYKHIPWYAIFRASLDWPPSKFRSTQILVFSETWLTALNRWFRTIPLDLWKLWFSAQAILHFLPTLPPPFDDMEFQLFGHRLKGQSEKLPQKMLALRLTQEWLAGSLGYLFVENYVDPEIKQRATAIAKEIRQVAADRASLIDWLEPKTREKAKKKVENIYLGIAYPSKIDRDEKTKLNPENLVENMFRLSELDFKDEMKQINTPLNPAEWDDPVFAVNAYYYNEGNRLILPAGILRWPFFHPNASDGWNFGGLGASIGHEICHAFDNDGKDYDETGTYRPWWSQAESKRYREKADALVKLFNKTEYFGHNLNGFLTLSENIADLGGVSIALAALKQRLKQKAANPQETKKQICDFFISFAVSWRTKERKEKAIQSLFMDVHAPPEARVNNIVSQFDEWYDCFNIMPGDKLYKESSKRISIF
jgi:putative endopeptidase